MLSNTSLSLYIYIYIYIYIFGPLSTYIYIPICICMHAWHVYIYIYIYIQCAARVTRHRAFAKSRFLGLFSAAFSRFSIGLGCCFSRFRRLQTMFFVILGGLGHPRSPFWGFWESVWFRVDFRDEKVVLFWGLGSTLHHILGSWFLTIFQGVTFPNFSVFLVPGGAQKRCFLRHFRCLFRDPLKMWKRCSR